MNKELLEMMDAIKVKKEEGRALLKDGKKVEAKAVTVEVKNMEEDFEIAKSLFEETKMEMTNEIKANANNEEKLSLSTIFAKAIVGKELTANEMTEMKNQMQEGLKEKGGVTVPDDVSTKIIELQRNTFDIRKYINVEPVTTLKGSRAIQANKPQAVGFASLDEGAQIQALHEPEFGTFEYQVRKYAGFIPLTNELLEDSDEAILAFIIRWMADNELNTYNYQVFNGSGTKAAQGIMTSEDLVKNDFDFSGTDASVVKKFKTILNVELEQLSDEAVVIMTNADGYNHLDGLTDNTGKALLQPDATKRSGHVFLGREIVKVPKDFLPNVGAGVDQKTPFIIGDLEALYTMFDRKQMSVESTQIGGGTWRSDTTEAKGVFRFDGRIVKEDAVTIAMAKLS
ncbi:capsid protein [Peribacillus butanolivorans]|uniref:phage major capsid protein n=1 Tax=Peribacillus butanolivorans TaxID=421767 RepID=UPI0006A6F57B|nr:phage major capsid protein [Peribacillus butanolivorans]KON69642.1 capsid protein [Peribacillus butanolivorans]